jgi:deoxyribose-phosphate aldolase
VNIKDLTQDQMNDLIRSVTERIQERLTQQAAPPANPPVSTIKTSDCAVSNNEECGGCGDCVTLNPEGVTNIIKAGADRVGSSASGSCSAGNLAPCIDHTLLKPNATDDQVEKLCKEAMEFNFASVCVNSSYVELSSRLLSGSEVKVCTVVGFPLGAMSTDSKAFETRDAVSKGADEIDMVINVGKLKSSDYEYVIKDIQAVVKAAQRRCVKVILETSSLSDDEKVAGCILSKAAGASYVKTSTGFGSGGATVEDIALMRRTVGPQMGVKASGGIRDTEKARQMIEAGATRIGASASVSIVEGNASPKSAGSGLY